MAYREWPEDAPSRGELAREDCERLGHDWPLDPQEEACRHCGIAGWELGEAEEEPEPTFVCVDCDAVMGEAEARTHDGKVVLWKP